MHIWGHCTRRVYWDIPPPAKNRRYCRFSGADGDSNTKEFRSMIILSDEVAITADSLQYAVGKPIRGGKSTMLANAKYYGSLNAALRAAVADCVRAGVEDGSITELRQVVAVQARLQQEFIEKLKEVNV